MKEITKFFGETKIMKLFRNAWETYSFDSMKAEKYLKEVMDILMEIKVDITDKKQLKEGFEKLFNIEYHNIPDLDNNNYILAPNHVSDFDALILGIIHENVKILSKKEWVENAKLMEFLNLNYVLSAKGYIILC